MGRQIIESRVTEDEAFTQLDQDLLLALHYETPSIKDRMAMELIVMEEKTQEEAGEVLGVSRSTARQYKTKAIRQLRGRLASEDFFA
jgi:RNA polymerase sigma factor (sigma-70 family)